ncbi:MAG TPA: hypothetical protein ENF82_00085 [Candidatus Methanomethylia archaeon]|nr:hypothetical protein [Candidatus Methanomethylicia archaeon]
MTRKITSFICALAFSVEMLISTGMLFFATAVGITVFAAVERGLALLERELLKEMYWLKRPSTSCLRRLGILLKLLREYSFERALLAATQPNETTLKVKLRSGEIMERLFDDLDSEERVILMNLLELARRDARKASIYARELYKTLSRLDRAAQCFEEWRKILSMRAKLLIAAFSTTLGFLSVLIPIILHASKIAFSMSNCLSLLLTLYAVASVSAHVISSIAGGFGRNLALATTCYVSSAIMAWSLTAPLSF